MRLVTIEDGMVCEIAPNAKATAFQSTEPLMEICARCEYPNESESMSTQRIPGGDETRRVCESCRRGS